MRERDSKKAESEKEGMSNKDTSVEDREKVLLKQQSQVSGEA